MSEFARRTRIGAPAADVFRWHARPGALERLTPPWTRVEVLERSGGIENGARLVMRIPIGPRMVRWVAEHRDYVEGEQFTDVQIEGPFRRWEHTHRFEPYGPRASFMDDRIVYEMPMGNAGALVGGRFVRNTLGQLFAYRHRVVADDLEALQMYPGTALRVAVTGSTGLVGSALVPFLTTGGHDVVRVLRRPPRAGETAVQWDPDADSIDAQGLEGLDAAVHLAGASVAGGRWTVESKARILDSRVRGTRLLAEALARRQRPPKTLISASAIGYYGDRGSEELREDSRPGSGFLAEVCREWEAATEPAEHAGIRVVHLRIGVVLSPAGGALASMLTPFRLGAGGRLGAGTQYMSWIAIDDVLGAILHVMHNPTLRGPVNAVSPAPVTNAEFTRVLARVLGRLAILPIPVSAVRLAFGEAADEVLLASARVEAAQLEASSYRFRYPDLKVALQYLLGRPS